MGLFYTFAMIDAGLQLPAAFDDLFQDVGQCDVFEAHYYYYREV